MEIRIGKTSRKCHATDRPFEHGEELISLVRMEDQILVREDYGKDAWNDERGAGALAVWSMLYIDPAVAEQEPPEVYSPLRQLFYEAVESEDRAELATAYLAAQLLRRQKVFRQLKESDDPEGEVRVALFTDRIGNRLIEVRDPHLSYGELEAGRSALMQRLQELEAPEELHEAHDGSEEQQTQAVG
jgi:hypothetical protein